VETALRPLSLTRLPNFRAVRTQVRAGQKKSVPRLHKALGMSDSETHSVASGKPRKKTSPRPAKQQPEAACPARVPGERRSAAESASAAGDLVARARRGDRGAFDALLAEVRPRALAVALKVLRNPDDAEDAVQDAFLKVWRNLGRFEGRSSFSTWVHRIVMNTSLDLLRRQACRPGAADEEETERQESATELAWDQTPEHAVVSAETRRLIHGALAVLSPVHRQAVTLREFEDHSYEEISQVAACPVGTVMSRLHHARKKLADELTGVLLEDGPALCAA
jgi:RNA polymerase sigma-70 factor, ECF subfamily